MSMFPMRPTAGAASAAPSPMSPASTQAYGQPTLAANNATTPPAGSSYPSAYPSAATSAYGQQSAYPGKGQSVGSPAASYGAGYANGGSAYPSAGSAYGSSGAAYASAASAYPSAYPSTGGAAAGSTGGGSAVGKTTNYGMPALSAWQPSTLPVSPWSTISPGGGAPLGGGVDTTTILRADLKALKRSRLKGWGYLMLSLSIFGTLGYFGVKRYLDMGKELKVAKQQLGDAKKGYEATLTKLGVSESAAAAATSNTPGAVVAPVPAVASAATTKLTDDLKKQLAGIAGLTVEARGDRVVVGLEQGTLFNGNEAEVSLGGYKVLYKFGKILKTVKDRRIVVTVPGDARRGKSWNIAAARAVSLGRFVIDDLSVDPHRVVSSAPGAPQGRGGRHIEFALESVPETTKS
jgi:flagellar motor protein MotB